MNSANNSINKIPDTTYTWAQCTTDDKLSVPHGRICR